MTDRPTTTPGVTRNPAPRPALQRRSDDDTVITARPRAGTAPATEHTLSLAPAGSVPDDDQAGRQKSASTDKLKAGRDDRASKDGKKHKHGRKSKGGKHPKAGKGVPEPHGSGARPDDDKELVIVLPKAVRRALNGAAVEHGTTPERLAALVLNEWLDH